MKILKKFYSIILILLLGLTIGLLFFLPACTPEYLTHITLISNVIWYSEDPEIKILILQENPTRGFGYIRDNNKIIDIYFIWRYGGFSIHTADQYGVINYPANGIEIKMYGSYNPRNNDSEADLKVNYDSMFGKYTNKKILLKNKKIDPENIDAKYRTNIRWTSNIKNLSFCIGFEEKIRGKGQLEYNHNLHDITFYWEDDSRFSVYELQGDIQSESPILTGTYISSNMKAVLTIENDSIFNHEFETIELVAKGLNDS